MTASPRPIDEILALLGTATDQQICDTVRLLDLLQQRGQLDLAAAGLRDRLVQLRPPRPITLGRLLALPLEGLLVLSHAWRPGHCQISRGILRRLHGLTLTPADDPLLIRATEATSRHNMHDWDVIQRAGEELWPAAAARLRAALADPREARRIWGDDSCEQLRTIATVLEDAATTVPLLWRLPPSPINRLSDDELATVQQLLKRAGSRGKLALETTLWLLVARAEQAGVMLELALAAEVGLARPLQESILQRIAAEHVAEIGSEGRAEGRPDLQARARSAADRATRLTSAVLSLASAPRSLKVSEAAIREAKRKATTIVETELTTTSNDILNRMRTERDDSPLDEASVSELEESARALRRIGACGQQLGLTPKVERVLGPWRDICRERALRAAGAADPEGAEAFDPVFDHIRMAEILLGPEAAMELLREAGPRAAPAPTKAPSGAPAQEAGQRPPG